MRSRIVLLISVVAIGALLGAFLQFRSIGDGPESPLGSPSVTAIESVGSAAGSATENARLIALAEQLAAEVRAREALQMEVDSLSAQLAQLIEDGQEAGPRVAAAQADATEPSADGVWFNEQALIDAGIEVTEADRIRTVYEELALDRLYLRDQAIREGWDGAKRREAFEALEERQQALQAELGEDTYDAYLYASGQFNRVRVDAVLAGSAADSVGIRNGDYILSYADQRVYNGHELRSATTAGAADEMVAVTIKRDDTVQEVYIPRGPLGIRMSSTSVAPKN